MALAGCDRLTIAPTILNELKASTHVVTRHLSPSKDIAIFSQKLAADEVSFRFTLNEDAMATEKLSEGIRQFSSDLRKLEELVKAKLNDFK